MNDIFHNPSFKKDFAFIRQLEEHNKQYQDKIWEKFVGSYNKKDEDIRIVNTRFELHPSGLSSDSEKGMSTTEENWEDEASFRLSSVSLELKSQKEKIKSSAGSKIILSATERKKLHKKLTTHLENGTLNKFEVKKISDHSPSSEDHMMEVENQKMEEVYLDRWKKSQSSTAQSSCRSISEISLKEEKGKSKEIDSERKKIAAEIEDLKNQLKLTEKKKNKLNYISGPETKTTAVKDRKKFEVRAPTELRKSKHHIEKCIGVIKDISMIMNDEAEPPDGSEDYTRRRVRTKEFTSRFSRIYLYPLMTHISKLISGEKCSVYSKFTYMFQLTYQALQACYNHLPNTVGTSSYHKLRECLNCAIDICDKSRSFFGKEVNYDNEDYVCIFKSHCVDLIHKIEDNFLSISTNSLLNSKSTRTSLIHTSRNNRNTLVCPENRKNLQKRFSMYNTNLSMKRDREWKRMMAAFEGKKPRVKSRYRTATFKHRPPVEKVESQIMLQQRPHCLDDKRSLSLLRNTPVVTPIDDDQIQTMIQYENERHDEDESEKEVLDEKGHEDAAKKSDTIFIEQDIQGIPDATRQQEDILTKLLQLVQDNEHKTAADIDANLTNTIMVLQKCLSVKNQNTKLLQKLDASEERQLDTHRSVMEINTERDKIKYKKEPMVTVTGAKNAQLICITDNNSITSVTSGPSEPIYQNDTPDTPKKNVKSSDVQTFTSHFMNEEGLKLNKSKSSIKISRVKRQMRLLQLLPKDYAINIIQYKLMFYKHHKGNYMYKKCSETKPWELMDSISEGIMDYALLGIAKEIEVNDLLENIYNAEFQY